MGGLDQCNFKNESSLNWHASKGSLPIIIKSRAVFDLALTLIFFVVVIILF